MSSGPPIKRRAELAPQNPGTRLTQDGLSQPLPSSGKGSRRDKNAIPKKLASFRQQRALIDATLLLQDEFWAQIASGYNARVSLFAYCVMNGATPVEALSLVMENRNQSFNNTHREHLLTNYYLPMAKPIIQRAMMLANVSPFWMSRVIRSIGDNPAVDPLIRLRAVDLAMKLTGVGDEVTTTFTHEIQDPASQRIVREEISRTIRTTIGRSFELNIPFDHPLLEPDPDPIAALRANPLIALQDLTEGDDGGGLTEDDLDYANR